VHPTYAADLGSPISTAQQARTQKPVSHRRLQRGSEWLRRANARLASGLRKGRAFSDAYSIVRQTHMEEDA